MDKTLINTLKKALRDEYRNAVHRAAVHQAAENERAAAFWQGYHRAMLQAVGKITEDSDRVTIMNDLKQALIMEMYNGSTHGANGAATALEYVLSLVKTV